MVSTRRRRRQTAAAAAATTTYNHHIDNSSSESTVRATHGKKGKGKEVEEEKMLKAKSQEYESLREQRIKENMKRMQKLGILDLSLNLSRKRATSSSLATAASERKNKKKNKDEPTSPPRRSSRLKSSNPVNYSELVWKKQRGSPKKVEIRIPEGSLPEVYTEQHEKLLGDCETAWTLYVDGYGKDGKRIYDQDFGQTCHQCRQKTLGHHTCCSKCNLVQGQFCGDCLYMRYGENVIEVNQNPDWICPVCRGICNCSLCRKARGWAPTGALYKKITSMGFKSVAHYLIQTRRSPSSPGNLESESLMLEDEGMPTGEEVPQPSNNRESVDVTGEKKQVPCSDTGNFTNTNESNDGIGNNKNNHEMGPVEMKENRGTLEASN